MEKLSRNRGSSKTKITIFKKFVDKVVNEYTDEEVALPEQVKSELNQRLVHVKKAFSDFNEIQNKIDELTDDEENTLSYREKIESDYFSIMAKVDELLSRGIPTVQAQDQDNNVNQHREIVFPNVPQNQSIKLPTIELPKFRGELEEWLGFRDTFTSLIHNNVAITNIQKFHYLRAALEGNAEQIIKSLEFSEANYVIAWEALCGRFDNKNLLVHNHIKAIFNIESIKKECASQLRKLLDNINKHLRALNALEQHTEHWDSLLIYLVSTKLDSTTARAWEKEKTANQIPTLEDLKRFLKSRADMLETLEINNLSIDKGSASKQKQSTQSRTKSLVTQKINCLNCNGEHHLQDCSSFLALDPSRRAEKVKGFRICLNCLRPGHFIKNCRANGCRKCQGKHNTLLHFEKVEAGSSSSDSSSTKESVVLSSFCVNGSEDGILSTASVLVAGANKQWVSARMILDNGSQTGLITERLCNILKLPKIPIDVTIGAINNLASTVSHRCNVQISSKQNNFKFNVSCLVVPDIAIHTPSKSVAELTTKMPSHLKLADPEFNKQGKIDILIGNNIFWSLISVGQIRLNEEGLVLQKTRLGWILAGPMPNFNLYSPPTKVVRCNLIQNVGIESQLVKFWELEEKLSKRANSKEEKFCESHFSKTVKRDEEGRFIVTIPFKGDLSQLGDSKEMAERRLLNIERKLERNSELKREYSEFLSEYNKLGHMSRIASDSNTPFSYYLPHHCVVRNESLSTKVRVVFDASASTTSGVSLNDLQMVGPNLQDDLFSILVRFRKHNFIISADIAKMYRQVLIAPEQRPLQRILWRENVTDPIGVFELNTITYGTAAASFLAIRCLMQLAEDCEEESPNIAKIIRKDFYVDDLLTGANTVEEATVIAKQVSQILSIGCFELRKWVSNDPRIVAKMIESDLSPNLINFSNDGQIKTLGLRWQANSDNLNYSVNISNTKRVSKRQILSDISRIFDPLGLLGPCIVLAKVLLQKLWLEKLSWDETLPVGLHSEWLEYRAKLPLLNSIKILRRIICSEPAEIQLHGFSDASKTAYGACIYLRSQDRDGNIYTRLLCSKSRVAPLQTQSIPRLELCGALELAKLCSKVKLALDLPINKIFLWCDATIVLGWLKKEPNVLPVFESNRVSQIQELTIIECWRHVRSEDNPADCISRGIAPNLLEASKLWWEGPRFLSKDEGDWPTTPFLMKEPPEVKQCFNLVAQIKLEEDYIKVERFQSFSRLIRVIAYCIRFANNCRYKDKRLNGPLLSLELRESQFSLARQSQRKSFSIELEALNRNEKIVKGRLAPLNPFLDSRGLIRVGGRLGNSQFDREKKHPLVLLASENFTKLLFIGEHERLLHAGPQLLLASIRERFWPVGGRNLARKVVMNCVNCFKVNPKSVNPLMGDLPECRVAPSPPFHVTGVDYAGPFVIKDRKGKFAKTSKCYISVFVCFSTKALHLELVSDATSEAFLASLRRFVSRRGKPAHMYSDNGINFVGAKNELELLGKFLLREGNNLAERIENIGIAWHFIPAYSPHFGGIWEAGVKSVKSHLKRVAGNNTLTFEELYTFLTQIEGVLNSRPITPLSPDPNDFSPLTPAHFLIGRPLTSIADPDLSHLSENRLSRWQLIQRLQQHFWSRWSKEYISELQKRTKWKQPYPELKQNSLVLMKDKMLPPLRWKLGRIIQLHPGRDGIARVATVRTSTDTTRIALHKLCPLPID